MNTNAAMIEPTRNDVCSTLPRTIGCRCPFVLRDNRIARQLASQEQSRAMLFSLRKYEQEDGVVNWAALHGAFQLSCLTY